MRAGSRVRSSHSYVLSGVRIRSNVALAELQPCDGAPISNSEVRFKLMPQCDSLRACSPRWFHRSRNPDGQTFLKRGRIDTGYLLRFPDYADFVVSKDGWEIACSPQNDGVSSATLRHLLLDHVMPLTLNLLGRDAIHASAVFHDGVVCAFAGEAGAGKSTLAASLVGSGAGFFADDCLALEQAGNEIIALPAYMGVRLWKKSAAALGIDGAESTIVADYTAKVRLAKGNFHPRPAPLGAIYFIERRGGRRSKLRDIMVEPLSGSDALMRLVGAAYRLDISDSAMLARQFAFLSRIAGRVALRKLIIPDNIAYLQEVRSAITTDPNRQMSREQQVSGPLALGAGGR